MPSEVTSSKRTSTKDWQDWLKFISNYFKYNEICNITSKIGDKRYYANIKILGNKFIGLLDSGATSSVISKSFSAKLITLGFISQELPTTTLSTADGTAHKISSMIYLPVEFSDGYNVVGFFIMDNLKHDIILGMNFFECFNLSIRHGIKNYEILESLDIHSNSETTSMSTRHSVISREELSTEQKYELDEVIEAMRNTIGIGLGRTKLIEHRIDTGDALPVKQRQYPFSPPIMRELEAEIEDMLEKDVIEPSYSSWRSPVLLVKKATGKNRLCLDSRQLNKLTKKDSYPLPRVTSILDNLKNAQLLSTIDLKSAFWQIPLEETSKEKTAFGLTGKGLFQFKVMPFGLNNASQTQQRLMDRLFPPEYEGNIFTYLDDIVICNKSFEEHIKCLRWVKDQLQSAGLTINLEKCHFARPSLKYLGYIIDKEGLRTDPEKVNAIVDYPRPSNFTELKRFIGLASWYRRFVENFAIIAAPLHELTKGGKKGGLIQWNKEAEESFLKLKTALTTTPVLSCPDFNKEFSIQCDASNKGIGAVLIQVVHGIEKPVAYTSRKLTDRECKFSASERELLSVVHAVEQFRPYVEGSHFKVISDHSALQWLYKTKDPHGRLARWAMRLQQFDYEIIHRKGKDNVVPDALSRAMLVDEINVIEIKPEDKDEWYRSKEESLKHKQEEDWLVRDNLLWKYLKLKQFPDENDSWKLVIPEKLRHNVLLECHNDPLSGHFGVKKTVNRVRQRYYWPSLIKDAKEHVRKCETCAKHKHSQLAPSGHMGIHKDVTEPFQIISMDLMGPFPRSRNGNTMLLVISCWFSKFALLFPLRNGKASNITKIVEEQVFLIFGVPKVIICDNGKQFVAEQFQDLSRNYGAEIMYTPYYHPQANPTERVNKVIGSAIASYVQDNHKDWDKYISHIGHAIRTAVHEVTGKTPSYLFFGRETSVISHQGKSFVKDPLTFDRSKYEENLKIRQEIYKDVQHRLKASYEVNKERYNSRRRVTQYQVGDIVWKKTKYLSNKSKNFMAKLAPKFEKAVITEKVSSDVYMLKSLRGKDLGKWHSVDLKRFV
ncbi:hypothetical protein JYU34_009728 [Plutella xylostella]|uniref:RNA-directed DNA polymerase n=1 Tax=Plutella xylostella TaxID=51655 RepID=A0ABQ7QKE2_PLUXY|nr:hypothetical protein JYU34_009728 [Plutella xylostella]